MPTIRFRPGPAWLGRFPGLPGPPGSEAVGTPYGCQDDQVSGPDWCCLMFELQISDPDIFAGHFRSENAPPPGAHSRKARRSETPPGPLFSATRCPTTLPTLPASPPIASHSYSPPSGGTFRPDESEIASPPDAAVYDIAMR
jgi:hypothetical protein